MAWIGYVSASSIGVANGSGEAHVYCLYFEPGGSIGEHLRHSKGSERGMTALMVQVFDLALEDGK